MSRTVLLAAGGTGGHLFPAEALARVLRRLGMRIVLATDDRAGGLAKSFPADEVVIIPSGTPSGRSPLKVLAAMVSLGRGYVSSTMLLRRIEPAVVVGFGGYPTVPPVLAATFAKIPTIVHEQNGVIGRANRFLARRVTMVATSFPEVKGIPSTMPGEVVFTGNPVRPSVIEAASTQYPPALKGGKMRILVFGGSQGARVMSEVVPAAFQKLRPEFLKRIVLTQQARKEDILQVRAAYARVLAAADVQPFFKDLPQRIADSHLIIARSGASTVSELATIGRPSILVPLPGAIDQDQAANARALADIEAATVIPQSEFTPERLAAELTARFEDPDLLTQAALAAKSAGTPDAAERLAAYVVRVGGLSVSEGLRA
jgi:UDP-N-acetylglucosamine--N-acetylmuramyl-(pentapeptide) pyrophosphoryl-undecaprenol N-acetylglucosamine transferase